MSWFWWEIAYESLIFKKDEENHHQNISSIYTASVLDSEAFF